MSAEGLTHIPVLLDEVLDGLNVRAGGVYFDGTLGAGGHARSILMAAEGVRLFATDLDTEAITRSEARLKDFADRLTIYHSSFKDIGRLVSENRLPCFDGALLDLGVSSPQLEDSERGFSYMREGKLDMRMNRGVGISAYDVVNGYSGERLERILFEYGEETFAKRIVRLILARRLDKPIETTLELSQMLADNMKGYKGGHPAKKTFQAIRIEVNGELEGLESAIRDLVVNLNQGGRLAVISFHSLEDRIVKNTLRELALSCVCPPKTPVCICGKRSEIKLITHKPVVPSERERKDNPRSACAKLRIAERK